MEGVINSLEFFRALPVSSWKVVSSSDDVGVYGFPCFLKADVSGHKTELGAVMRCNNLNEAEKNHRLMRKKFLNSKIIVQEAFDGIEMIVGLKADKVFGKLLVIGFGGIFAEVTKDVVFRALPLSRKEIIKMVRELEGFGIFSARGKKYDLEKFYTLIEKAVYLGEKKNIVELDLNPVIVGIKDSRIVDARVELN